MPTTYSKDSLQNIQPKTAVMYNELLVLQKWLAKNTTDLWMLELRDELYQLSSKSYYRLRLNNGVFYLIYTANSQKDAGLKNLKRLC